jgi:hypothetical protein
MTHLSVENPYRRIVLQNAINEGEAMKIAKFFRFLRSLITRVSNLANCNQG